MKKLGMKARVFIDILQKIPFGTNNTTCMSMAVDEEDKEKYRKEAEEKLTKRFGNAPEKWMINAEAAVMASDEADKEQKWLVDNGYLFQKKFKRHNGRMVVTYTGVTAKGWSVADKYLALVK